MFLPALTQSRRIEETGAHSARFRRAAILGPAGSTNVEEVVTYGIGAVYTPPEHRQRGYAKHLMRLLHYILAPRASLPPFPGEWGLAPPTPPGVGGDAAFSELYSGVGDTFYAKCTQGTEKEGWGKRPTVVRQWDLSGKADEVEAVVKAVEEPKGAELEFVSASNLGELEIEAERRIRRDLSSSDTKRTRVAILPRYVFSSRLVPPSVSSLPFLPPYLPPSFPQPHSLTTTAAYSGNKPRGHPTTRDPTPSSCPPPKASGRL